MSNEKIILGIDPGTNIMGFGLIKCIKSEIKLLQYGIITLSKEPNHEMKLKKIFTRVTELIGDYKPDEIAIESPFFGKNVQSMLKLGRAQGVAMVAGAINNINITEYAPKKIKQSITGNGNASKDQLCEMVKKILDIKNFDGNKFDATDALGAAICHSHQKSSNQTPKKSWKKFIDSNPDKII